MTNGRTDLILNVGCKCGSKKIHEKKNGRGEGEMNGREKERMHACIKLMPFNLHMDSVLLM